jgi:hypothetical protein
MLAAPALVAGVTVLRRLRPRFCATGTKPVALGGLPRGLAADAAVHQERACALAAS